MQDYKEVDLKKLQILVEAAQKPYVTVREASMLYSLGSHTVARLSMEAGARRMIGSKILINVKQFNDYIESVLRDDSDGKN